MNWRGVRGWVRGGVRGWVIVRLEDGLVVGQRMGERGYRELKGGLENGPERD